MAGARAQAAAGVVEWNCGNYWRIKVGLRQNLCQPFGSNGMDHEKES
jgi:hypothetical protein